MPMTEEQKAKNTLKERRKVAWQAALVDPSMMEKIQKDKKNYRTRHRNRLADKQRAWAKANPDKVINTSLKIFYGISLEEYEVMLAAQKGVCAICHQPEKTKGRRLAVDHCHRTGRIRGLLCGCCNKGIGLLQENRTILKSAISYLDEWGVVLMPPEDEHASPSV